MVPITPADVERQRLTSSDGSWDTRTVAASYRRVAGCGGGRITGHADVSASRHARRPRGDGRRRGTPNQKGSGPHTAGWASPVSLPRSRQGTSRRHGTSAARVMNPVRPTC